ncbi:hypothetical protein L1987_15687 [Smallanthus sonchifolius]|uniref:Uncharacterized protein n=1 Tax=Smallanthus sonchifolius TaxID=185202 RepID=A0ACB9J8J4_9ASTR|nr:hypothetical protein L1987_15687 [Smallanthus sonchifolius]
MLNIQSTPGDRSAIPADTDPTPSTPHPEQQSASTIRTPVHTTKDAQAQTLLTHVLDDIVQPEHRAPVATTYTRKRGKITPSSLASKAQTQPNSPHSESQHSAPLEHFLSLLNLSVEEPDQDDVPSPTTTISEVLIDLASNTPNPSSSTLKDHSRSYERVDVEEAVTTAGPSNDQEDSDNIAKTLTTATHSEDVSLETPLTERNPRCQETMGDGDEEARPKAPSGSKDSTTVDEDILKLHILELTARVNMIEAHQCPTFLTPSFVSVGTQTDAYFSTDATKKGRWSQWRKTQTTLMTAGCISKPKLLRISFSAASTLDVADRQIISSSGWLHLAANQHLCC